MADGTPELHEVPDNLTDLRIRPVAAPDQSNPAYKPTQFEKDRPGKPISAEGVAKSSGSVLEDQAIGAVTSSLKKAINPIGASIDEAKSMAGEIKAGWQRGSDPRSKLGDAILSGLGSMVGVSAKKAAEHAARGESNEIIGEAVVPAAEAILASAAPDLPGAVKIEGHPEAGSTSFSGAPKGGFKPNYSGLRVREVETPKASPEPAISHEVGDKFNKAVLKSGDKNVGQVNYTVDGDKASVTGSRVDPEFQGKGHGTKLYTRAFDEAKKSGAKTITSDLSGQTSMDAGAVWKRLKDKGYAVEEVPSKAGSPGYKLDLTKEMPHEKFSRVKASPVFEGGKGFDEQKYSKSFPVEVEWPDGTIHQDEVKGLNEGHALSRAKGNWPDASHIRVTDGVKSPKQMIEKEGLVYKGELSKGSGVHMFEHPDYPGKTAALNEKDLSPEAVSAKMKSKLKEFGVDKEEK